MHKKIPSYRFHKVSGNAVVTLDGQDHYLGKHDTPESRSKYDREIASWIARGRRPAVPQGSINVGRLVKAYYVHSETYYRKAGEPTSSLAKVRSVGATLSEHFGDRPVDSIRTTDLKSLLDVWSMVHARSTANVYLSTARSIFRWGVQQGIVKAETWHAMKAVDGLRKGRTIAREPEPIGTVDRARIDAVLAVAVPVIADMIRVQLLTGMRPGEIATARPDQIDRSERVWAYRPGRHKTEHRGKGRVVAIGPKAQTIISPWLDKAGPGGLIFPATHPSNPTPRALGNGYARAIVRACRRAKVEPWTPNQLRHNAATAIRKAHGIEAAGQVLGHSNMDTTEIYAEKDLDAVKRIMWEMG